MMSLHTNSMISLQTRSIYVRVSPYINHPISLLNRPICRVSGAETIITYKLAPAVIACMSAFAVGYPVDTIKVRLQNGEDSDKKDVLTGFLPSVCMCGLYALVYFASYNNLVQNTSITTTATISAMCTLLFKVPSKVLIKTMQRYGIGDTKQVAQKIYKTSGIFGFFRGFFLYVVSDIPENIIKYNMYDFLEKLPIVLSHNAAGTLVGIVTSFCLQPIDVLSNVVMSNVDGRKIKLNEINYFKGLYLSLVINTLQCLAFYNVYHVLKML